MKVRSPDRRLKALQEAFVAVARELHAATEGDKSEEALDEILGRVAHISASAVMTIRGELSPVVSAMPMFTCCPLCQKFHAPGFCS
jgi:hypothetical protein